MVGKRPSSNAALCSFKNVRYLDTNSLVLDYDLNKNIAYHDGSCPNVPSLYASRRSSPPSEVQPPSKSSILALLTLFLSVALRPCRLPPKLLGQTLALASRLLVPPIRHQLILFHALQKGVIMLFQCLRSCQSLPMILLMVRLVTLKCHE
jgi:hypothetical protein